MLLVVPFLLGDLDLGGFDAESDHLLSDHFVTTPYVREALTGRRTLFLGRKGSGKSALFRSLPALISDQESTPALTVPITPDAYAWEPSSSMRRVATPLKQPTARPGS